MIDTFRDKEIMVTGGAGSIGSVLVRKLLEFNPKRVFVFDNDEAGLFRLQQSIGDNRIRYLIGDIRDKERLKTALQDIDIVFHAAALKHVPLCEYNPFESVCTNVIGTQNLIEAAREKGVERFVLISTDKAVNPINTMGASKLLGERLTINGPIGESKTCFCCVRFGNVLNSAGSVIPIFKEQIKKGGPVTITSREMTRFFMSIEESVGLVLKAAASAVGREIFILKMPSLRIVDLAEVLVEELAPKHNKNSSDIELQVMGIRPGEKLHEELMTPYEFIAAEEKEEMYVLKSAVISPHYMSQPKVNMDLDKGLVSNTNDMLNKEQIRLALKERDVL